ncbi:hypothetical protein B0H14DRAFT_2609885 [Mycena olivaceomarginata]|nr:hypothetical protein B0H14DRAFT_2609885 [Mycena olivaceomarginata]
MASIPAKVNVYNQQDAPPLRSGTKEEKVTENDRKDLLHWQQDIPLIGSRNLEDRKETLFKFSMLRECDGAEKTHGNPRRWQRTGIDIDAGESYEMLRIRTVIFDGQIERRDQLITGLPAVQKTPRMNQAPRNRAREGAREMNIGVGGLTELPIYSRENCGSLHGHGLNLTAAQATLYNSTLRSRLKRATLDSAAVKVWGVVSGHSAAQFAQNSRILRREERKANGNEPSWGNCTAEEPFR